MTSSRIVGIALCCGVAAALILVLRGWGPDTTAPSATADGASAEHRAGDAHGLGGTGTQSLGGPGAVGGAHSASAPGLAHHGDGSEHQQGESLRRHLPPAIVAGQSGTLHGDDDRIADNRGGAGGAGGGGVNGSGASGVAHGGGQASAAHHAPPAGAEPGARGASDAAPAEAAPQAAEDPAAPRPDAQVLYDSGDHVFDTAAQVEVTDAGPINGQAGTVSFWVQPEWQPNNGDAVSFLQLGENGVQITKNGSQLRLGLNEGNGWENAVGADIGDWKAGDWRQVTLTWADSGLSLYIDGQQQMGGAPIPPEFQKELHLFVGGAAFPDRPAVALAQLTNVTVLNRDASGDEVRQMFESGAPPRQ